MKRLILMLWCAAAAFAQVATEANRNYQTPEQRDQLARNLAGPQRDATEKPHELINEMELKPGMTVADVGTGAGFMLPFLSRAVGPNGKVIGEDIFPDFIEKAKMRARTSNATNVTFILGTPTDPKLPGDSVDAILVLDAYHHFDYPDQMLAGLRDALLSGGRLFIVDYFRTASAMPNGQALQHIRLDRDEVIREVEDNGFRLVWKRDHIPNSQYILCFEKKQ